MSQRFLTLADVAEVLNISATQTYALVRRGDLPAIKIGGRGQWRVEQRALEEYIERMYAETERFVTDHPFERDEAVEPDEAVEHDEAFKREETFSPD
ncbi:MAG TPA: helix-turn-helix domain-containing protein [Actinomycetes bacterium]|nr:helix-turn-helix domain-containing protein [Actinomycetes bacterium]